MGETSLSRGAGHMGGPRQAQGEEGQKEMEGVWEEGQGELEAEKQENFHYAQRVYVI